MRGCAIKEHRVFFPLRELVAANACRHEYWSRWLCIVALKIRHLAESAHWRSPDWLSVSSFGAWNPSFPCTTLLTRLLIIFPRPSCSLRTSNPAQQKINCLSRRKHPPGLFRAFLLSSSLSFCWSSADRTRDCQARVSSAPAVCGSAVVHF